VRIAIGKKTIYGIAEDIDDNGMLLIKMQSGEYRNISSGDITFVT